MAAAHPLFKGAILKERIRRQGLRRTALQLASAFLHNPMLAGWFTGKIYTGKLKSICLPGLNCYSCPGAAGACPIGSLQGQLMDQSQLLPFYVLGFILLFGTLLGRAVCGLLCPFGFFQDLLYKVPVKKWKPEIRQPKLHKALRRLRFVILAVTVFLLPFLGRWISALASPWFCKLVCPAGTVFAGWPLVSLNADLRPLIGWIFTWKSFLALLTIGLCVVCSRFFCRYICPLGTLYGFFNKYALYRLRIKRSRCVGCHVCTRVCPVASDVPYRVDAMDCIRCGKCVAACPYGALSIGFQAPGSASCEAER